MAVACEDLEGEWRSPGPCQVIPVSVFQIRVSILCTRQMLNHHCGPESSIHW